MATLQFRFDLEKLVNALAYFAHAGVSDLTKLKAAKLLYLSDQRHLFRFGRPITGDRYIAMDLGPVPESAYQLIGRLADPEEAEDPVRRSALERLSVHKGMWQQYAVIRAKQKPDLDVFSDSEVEVLKSVVTEFGPRKARDLVDLTHEHAAYKRADAGRSPGSSVELPYDYFFDDAPPGSDAARALADEEQTDRRLCQRLRRRWTRCPGGQEERASYALELWAPAVLLPFDSVLRRGVILFWKQYGELDDPAFAG